MIETLRPLLFHDCFQLAGCHVSANVHDFRLDSKFPNLQCRYVQLLLKLLQSSGQRSPADDAILRRPGWYAILIRSGHWLGCPAQLNPGPYRSEWSRTVVRFRDA